MSLVEKKDGGARACKVVIEVRARRLLARALEMCLVTGRNILYLVKYSVRPTYYG